MQVNLEQFRTSVVDMQSSHMPTPEQRFALFRDYDPFPEIAPALLHSGHIASYAITTGMIDPFDVDDLSKPATLLVKLEGMIRYRDNSGVVKKLYLSNEPNIRSGNQKIVDEIIIKPNSLYYVTLKPMFRIPSYLAGRFNLMIRDVYRGFLVGTGPLVDPGFNGRLSIPLHNFTNNEYVLRADEGFVYFEFTKLSWSNPPRVEPIPHWVKPAIASQPPFPSSKNKRKTLDNYLDEATSNGPAQSSIGMVVKNAEEHAKTAKNLLDVYTFGGLIAIVALLLGAWSLYSGVQEFTLAAEEGISDRIEATNDKLIDLSRRFELFRSEVERDVESTSSNKIIELNSVPSDLIYP